MHLPAPAIVLAESLAAGRCQTTCVGFEFSAGTGDAWVVQPLPRPSRFPADAAGLGRAGALLAAWAGLFAEAAAPKTRPARIIGGSVLFLEPARRGLFSQTLDRASARIVRALGVEPTATGARAVDIEAFLADAIQTAAAEISQRLAALEPPFRNGAAFDLVWRGDDALFLGHPGVENAALAPLGRLAPPDALRPWLDSVSVLLFRVTFPSAAGNEKPAKNEAETEASASPAKA